MRTYRLRFLAPALTLLWVCGCAGDICKSHEPAFQVDLILAPAVDASSLHTLTADVSAAGQRKVVPLSVSRLKSTGRASFDVTVGSAATMGFEAEVRVEARDRGGRVVARSGLKFSGTADACNLISLTLAPLTELDSGPPVDTRPDLASHKDGPVKPLDVLPPGDLSLPDLHAVCVKDGAACLGGKGTCYKGFCCTGCWSTGPWGVTCHPGTTLQNCGLGGSLCVPCLALHGCKNGMCVPLFP